MNVSSQQTLVEVVLCETMIDVVSCLFHTAAQYLSLKAWILYFKYAVCMSKNCVSLN